MGDYLDEAIIECDDLDMLQRGLESIRRKIERLEREEECDSIFVSIGNVYDESKLCSDLFHAEDYEEHFIVLSGSEFEFLRSKFENREFKTVEPTLGFIEDLDEMIITQFYDVELIKILKDGDFRNVFKNQFKFWLDEWNNDEKRYFLITRSFIVDFSQYE